VLRIFAAEQLPAYMIPTTWVLLDALPRTPNGKVDLRALPDPSFDRAASGGEFAAPRSATERRIADILSSVLSVREVGIQDNFFALGGHSLLAVQVISRVWDELGVTLTLRAIFDSPSVMELAAEVDRAQAVPTPPQPPALVRVARR
jgi:acyl carrier protein